MAEYDTGDRRVQRLARPHRIRAADLPTVGTSEKAGGGTLYRTGAVSSLSAHAATVTRSHSKERSLVQRSLLRLQRQHGNQYVGRVLREAGAAGDDGGRDVIERSITVQRDDAPSPTIPQAAAPPVATPGGATTPGVAAPAGQPAAGDQVAIDWWIDWQAKETGVPIANKSNARTGRDAAQGTLKVLPVAGGGGVGVFKWVNAAPSGPVQVATMHQPKDKGGMVSSDISYGKPPSAGAVVTVTETAADTKHVGKTQLPAKQKAAMQAASAALEAALTTEGGIPLLEADLKKAAQAAVGASGGGYTYDVAVAVKLDRGSENPRAVSPVPYDGASNDDRRTATITVPTEVQKLHGTSSAELEKSLSESETDKTYSADQKTDEKLDSKTSTLINDVSTSFESIVTSSWENWKKQRTVTSLGGSFSLDGDLKGSAGAAGEIKDLTIDLGALLGIVLIENPLLALAVKKAIGKVTVGGKGHVDFDAFINGHVEGKADWTKEDLDQTLTKIDSEIKNKITTRVYSEVHEAVTHRTTDSHTTVESKDKTKTEGGHKKSASSTETVGIKYIVGEPQLHIQNG